MNKLCCNQLASLDEEEKKLDKQLQMSINNSRITRQFLEKKMRCCKKEIRKMNKFHK